MCTDTDGESGNSADGSACDGYDAPDGGTCQGASTTSGNCGSCVDQGVDYGAFTADVACRLGTVVRVTGCPGLEKCTDSSSGTCRTPARFCDIHGVCRRDPKNGIHGEVLGKVAVVYGFSVPRIDSGLHGGLADCVVEAVARRSRA